MASKFHNRKVTIDGHKFDSKAEGSRYRELKLLQKAGEISGLCLQPRYEIIKAFKDNKGAKHRKTEYVADFAYREKATRQHVVEDVKGKETEVFRIKAKLFMTKYPKYDFRIVRAS